VAILLLFKKFKKNLVASLLLIIEKYNSNEAIKFFLNFLNSNNIATYNDYISKIDREKKNSILFKSCVGLFF